MYKNIELIQLCVKLPFSNTRRL